MDNELDSLGNMYGPGNIRVGQFIARLLTTGVGDANTDYWRVVVVGDGHAGQNEEFVCYIDRTPDTSREKLAYGLLNPLLNIALPTMLKQTGGVVTDDVILAMLLTLSLTSG